MEIGHRADDSTTPAWAGKFFIDNITMSTEVVAPGVVINSIAPDKTSETLALQGGKMQLVIRGTLSSGSEKDVTAAAEGTTYTGYDTNIISVSTDGLVTAQAAGTTTITVANGDKTAQVAITVSADKPESMYSFETGLEGWNKSDPADTSVTGVFSIASCGGTPRQAGIPGPWNGGKLLQVDMAGVATDIPKMVGINYDTPLDLSGMTAISYTIYSWGGVPGKPGDDGQTGNADDIPASYNTIFRLTSTTGETFVKQTEFEANTWETITVDISECAFKDRIAKMEIGHVMANASIPAWQGKFFIDDISKVSIPADVAAPTVTSTTPANSATSVGICSTIVVNFSENIQNGSAISGVTLKKGTQTIAATCSITDNKLTITPSASLDYSSAYMVTIPAGAVEDMAGNGLTAVYEFGFTTAVNPNSNNGNGNGNNNGNNNDNEADVTVPVGSGDVTATATLDKATGIMKVDLANNLLNQTFAKEESDEDGIKTVTVEIPKVDGAKAYELAFIANSLSTGNANRIVTVKTDLGAISIPDNMLKKTGIKGSDNVSIKIEEGDKSALSPEEIELVGDRKLIELNLLVNGKQTDWSNPNSSVTVSIPYTPTAEELKDPEHIVVVYLDGKGNVVQVPSGRYDSRTGLVTFTTTHFSQYAIAFVKKSFEDIGNYSWAMNSIEVLASKGIFNGTSSTTFTPSRAITRGEYLAMLVNTLGLTADFATNFSDMKPTDFYYQAAGVSKALGITEGTGNNTFDPKATISRQDMMVLTEKALRVANKLKANQNGDLNRFKDEAKVAGYAKNSIANLTGAGLVEGSNSLINPTGRTTRAEAAVLLHRIYQYI